MHNLQRLRTDLTASGAAYEDILAGGKDILDQLGSRYAYDPYSDGIGWNLPDDESFWLLANALLRDIAGHVEPANAGDVLTRGSPQPHPDLNQIPPM